MVAASNVIWKDVCVVWEAFEGLVYKDVLMYSFSVLLNLLPPQFAPVCFVSSWAVMSVIQ